MQHDLEWQQEVEAVDCIGLGWLFRYPSLLYKSI